MKFITVLSSPVGTFNKLEAVDPAQPAKGNTVNFCTNIGTQGVVELKGTKPAALTTVSLSNNTTLGKTDEGKFSLSKIELHSGGNIRGGRLFGNTFTVNNAASGKANNVYGSQLTVAGAKTKMLDVNSGASKITAQHDAVDMVWSNQYQSDDACKEGASYEKCKQQYLLKQKGEYVAEEKVTCFTRIDWRTLMNNRNEIKKDWDEWLKDVSDWDVNKWWFGAATSPNANDEFGTTDSEGFTIKALWYDGGGNCSRCEYAKPCKCTPGKEYRLNTVLAKVLHVPDKWHVSQLEGWAVGICEETTPDKCLSWKGSYLGLAIGGVAWTKAAGPIAPKTPGGGTVKNYEVETIVGIDFAPRAPDSSYHAYCDYTD